MMSRRDAMRSYRRAFKRAYLSGPRPYSDRLFDVLGRRGDTLHIVFARCGATADDAPVEVIDAITMADVRCLRNEEAVGEDW